MAQPVRTRLARRREHDDSRHGGGHAARFIGRAVAALAADPLLERHNGGSFSSGGLAREYGFTAVDGSRPDCWRHMVEVQNPGRPADATGYR